MAPLGTDILSPPRRLAYWALCAGFVWPVVYFTTAVCHYFMRSNSHFLRALALMSATLLFSGPCAAALLYTFGEVFFGLDYSAKVKFPAIYLIVVTVTVPYAPLFYYLVLQPDRHSGPLTAGTPEDRAWEHTASAGAHSPTPDLPRSDATGNSALQPPHSDHKDGESRPLQLSARSADPSNHAEHVASGTHRRRFLEVVAPKLVGDLIFLKSEGHYINVHATGGSCLVMMPFKDAVDDLGTVGMRVHRCYWVAHGHVIELLNRDGRTVLRLTDGHEVPVSRTYLPTVRGHHT